MDLQALEASKKTGSLGGSRSGRTGYGVSSRSGRSSTVGIDRGSSPLARPDALNLFESRRVLTKTGAVRARWDREQLIGGKPERLVSRVLRVLAEVLDQLVIPDMTEV
ncbi:hypothetical protein F0Q45_25240 [Mycobacterium simiae]|uniref:Uncharacterized protein n=1 Tax=Mycobacterium simiae TaxID=1784 RepID=A0A5B1B7Q1_MYCSI|nr:hypothetical protein [Mycobacterium simiae]KAA1243991.1 hypothetical protein F0Q45_25240 [Mycobacterium simiae]